MSNTALWALQAFIHLILRMTIGRCSCAHYVLVRKLRPREVGNLPQVSSAASIGCHECLREEFQK